MNHAKRLQRYTVSDSGCWLWQGCIGKLGYGLLHARGQRLAHRYFWIEANGPIPDGLELDHLCRVRSCVNPAHLELVTHRDNVLRGNTFSRSNAAKTHCPHGHAYEGRNLIKTKSGRACRTCSNAAQRRFQATHPGYAAAQTRAHRARKAAERAGESIDGSTGILPAS